jgi:hypothetical protein
VQKSGDVFVIAYNDKLGKVLCIILLGDINDDKWQLGKEDV